MAKEFSLVSDPNPTVYRSVRIASQAYQVGDAVQADRTADAVDVTPATSSTITAAIFGVAMSAQVSTDTSLLVALVNNEQEWAADNTNTPSTNHNYQRMVLTDKGTVNNTGTDSTSTAAVWMQTGILSGNRTVGSFLAGFATT
jgi:hypothetical protein